MNLKRMVALGVYYVVYFYIFYILCLTLKEYFNHSIWKEALSLTTIWFVVLKPLMGYIEDRIINYTNMNENE
jgi:hypothetical protein